MDFENLSDAIQPLLVGAMSEAAYFSSVVFLEDGSIARLVPVYFKITLPVEPVVETEQSSHLVVSRFATALNELSTTSPIVGYVGMKLARAVVSESAKEIEYVYASLPICLNVTDDIVKKYSDLKLAI